MDELVRLVREGSIGLSAMPYNLHTDTCSTDELHELKRTVHAQLAAARAALSVAADRVAPVHIPDQVAAS